jgi:glycosyltransferase involved in cell wall biosynthesis
LALSGHARIDLVSRGHVTDPEIRRAVSRIVEVPDVEARWRDTFPWLRRAGDLLAVLLSRQPQEVRAFRPARRALASAISDTSTDIVIVEYAGLAPLVRRPRSGRWILTLHNLPSRMADQRAAVMPRRRQRWLLRREAVIAARFERRMAGTFDTVITCSEEDAESVGAFRRVIVVPNGVDVDKFQPAVLPEAPRIVMTGALYTDPNVDGATWFCEQVLPLVRAEMPDVEFDLVGARPDHRVTELAGLPGVHIHADVQDVVPFLHAARVAVVPIRLGSGSRLKALEALAAGRPVVGTTIGLEGLQLTPNEHVVVADQAEAFATAILRLLHDDKAASSLIAAGRQLVQERYSWVRIGEAFVAAVIPSGHD